VNIMQNIKPSSYCAAGNDLNRKGAKTPSFYLHLSEIPTPSLRLRAFAVQYSAAGAAKARTSKLIQIERP